MTVNTTTNGIGGYNASAVICKCGSRLFHRALRTGGWWIETIDGSGEILDTRTDSVRYGAQPRTVKCVDCGARCPNPDHGANDAE